MKRLILLTVLLSTAISIDGWAQETYGKTLNLGIGVGGYSGYYRYTGHSVPVLNLNYEFDVAKDFTLAPFISVASYRNDYYWGNNNTAYKYYRYHEIVIPIGVKGTYYFDDLLNINSKWDFYLAGSLGFVMVRSRWDAGYGGDVNYFDHGRSIFLDAHIGGEYHINDTLGVYLDASSGVSTLGVAFHAIN